MTDANFLLSSLQELSSLRLSLVLSLNQHLPLLQTLKAKRFGMGLFLNKQKFIFLKLTNANQLI